jgi:hypothetical protein
VARRPQPARIRRAPRTDRQSVVRTAPVQRDDGEARGAQDLMRRGA